MSTGTCPYCGLAGTGEPCNPSCEPPGVPGVRSTPAHAKKRHLLSLAHSPTWNAAGTRVYVVCGWQGCPQRLEVDPDVWRDAERRREAAQREETPF